MTKAICKRIWGKHLNDGDEEVHPPRLHTPGNFDVHRRVRDRRLGNRNKRRSRTLRCVDIVRGTRELLAFATTDRSRNAPSTQQNKGPRKPRGFQGPDLGVVLRPKACAA